MVGCRPRLTGGPCIWLCLPSTRALSPLQSRQPFPGEQILRTCGLPTASMAEPAPARLAGWLVASTAQPALGPPRAHRSALPTGPSAGFPLTREPGCTPRPRPGSVSSASKLGTCMSSSPQRHQQVPPPPLRAPRHVPRSHSSRRPSLSVCLAPVPPGSPCRVQLRRSPPLPWLRPMSAFVRAVLPPGTLTCPCGCHSEAPGQGAHSRGWSGSWVTPRVGPCALGCGRESCRRLLACGHVTVFMWLFPVSVSVCVLPLTRTPVLSCEGPGSPR